MRTVIGFLLALNALVVSAIDISNPGYIEDCQPCSIAVGKGLPPHTIKFQIKAIDDGLRVITGFDVSHGESKPSQTLIVSNDMVPVMPGAKIFFGGVDINFDGYLDLVLITRRGIANAYADYWLYSPSADQFDKVGNYPVFTLDSAKHQLSSFERGGKGGTISDTKLYSFVSGKLTLLRHEEQRPAGPNQVVTTIWEFPNGTKKLISRNKSKIDQPNN